MVREEHGTQEPARRRASRPAMKVTASPRNANRRSALPCRRRAGGRECTVDDATPDTPIVRDLLGSSSRSL